MDNLGNLTSGPNAALVMLAFLQTDCSSSEYRKELYHLSLDIIPSRRDINCNGVTEEPSDDGDLQTDGHLSSHITPSLFDIQPLVDLPGHGNRADVAAIRHVAEELRAIAAQLEHDVVAEATQSLSRTLSSSTSNKWKDHLLTEVTRLTQAISLQGLSPEPVMVAVTLTLVKGVCEQAPVLLRSLFDTALDCIRSLRAR